ncbi:MAG: hypothetical protein SangKO_046500 [Sandaracinaceae bacterium]
MTIPYASTALDLMMSLLPHVHALVVQVRVHDKNLADELFRAAKSVALNHSEADGVRKGHRKERIGTAAAHAPRRSPQCAWRAPSASATARRPTSSSPG